MRWTRWVWSCVAMLSLLLPLAEEAMKVWDVSVDIAEEVGCDIVEMIGAVVIFHILLLPRVELMLPLLWLWPEREYQLTVTWATVAIYAVWSTRTLVEEYRSIIEAVVALKCWLPFTSTHGSIPSTITLKKSRFPLLSIDRIDWFYSKHETSQLWEGSRCFLRKPPSSWSHYCY